MGRDGSSFDDDFSGWNRIAKMPSVRRPDPHQQRARPGELDPKPEPTASPLVGVDDYVQRSALPGINTLKPGHFWQGLYEARRPY